MALMGHMLCFAIEQIASYICFIRFRIFLYFFLPILCLLFLFHRFLYRRLDIIFFAALHGLRTLPSVKHDHHSTYDNQNRDPYDGNSTDNRYFP